MNDDVRSLHRRLARLERRQTLWSRIFLLSGFLTAAFVLIGAADFKTMPILDDLRTRQLTLLDRTGRVRGSLRVGTDGSVALALLDEEGWTRAGLAVLQDGRPRLLLYEKNARARGGLELTLDGSAAVTLSPSVAELYQQRVTTFNVDLPTVQGLRPAKRVVSSEIRKAAAEAYPISDAERLPAR